MQSSSDSAQYYQGSSTSMRSRATSPPPFSSPLFGPVPSLVRSHRGSPSSSPASSSPQTSPSPWSQSREVDSGSPPPALHLPPQAYPSPKLRASGSPLDPVSIPPQSRSSSSHHQYSESYGTAGSETLRYNRRPGPMANLTSPVALYPIGRASARRTSSSQTTVTNVSSSLGFTSDSVGKESALKSRCDRPGCNTRHTDPLELERRGAQMTRGDILRGGGIKSHSEDEHLSGSPRSLSKFGVRASPKLVAHHPSPSGRVLPLPPPLGRRRSIPMHHSNILPPSPAHVPVYDHLRTPPPLSLELSASPPKVSPPPPAPVSEEHDRGRNRRRESDAVAVTGSDSSATSRSRSSALGSRSRTREVSPVRARLADDGIVERGRRPSERERERRGRCGLDRTGADDGSSPEASGDIDERGSSRRRSTSRSRHRTSSRGRASPPGQRDYLPVFERTPEVHARSLSESPPAVPVGGTLRGRRPTVVAKPEAFTALDGGHGTIRVSSTAKPRGRIPMDRTVDVQESANACIGPIGASS